MPVKIDSAVSQSSINAPLPSATSGSLSQVINVSSTASDLFAVVVVLWCGYDTDCSGAEFAATFGGENMDPLGDPVFYDSNKSRLDVFTLADPPTGAGKNITTNFSSMPAGSSVYRNMWLIGATYSGVADLDGMASDTGSASATNSLTVDSVAPAHRVVFIQTAWELPSGGWFTSYDQTIRAQGQSSGHNALVLADAPGDSSVTATGALVQGVAGHWAAKGFNLSPAPVNGDVSFPLSASLSSGGDFYRASTPSPKRTWYIGGGGGGC